MSAADIVDLFAITASDIILPACQPLTYKALVVCGANVAMVLDINRLSKKNIDARFIYIVISLVAVPVMVSCVNVIVIAHLPGASLLVGISKPLQVVLDGSDATSLVAV